MSVSSHRLSCALHGVRACRAYSGRPTREQASSAYSSSFFLSAVMASIIAGASVTSGTARTQAACGVSGSHACARKARRDRWRDGRRTVIAGRVLLAGRTLLRDLRELDGAVLDVEGEALAALIPQLAHRTRVVERHAKRAGDAATRVAHHRDEAALLVDTLVLGPSVHHRAIVDAINDHFVDAKRLEVFRLLKVAWHLPRGSGRGESSRQADNNDLLAGDALGEIDLGRRKPEVELERRHLGADKHRRRRQERRHKSNHHARQSTVMRRRTGLRPSNSTAPIPGRTVGGPLEEPCRSIPDPSLSAYRDFSVKTVAGEGYNLLPKSLGFVVMSPISG